MNPSDRSRISSKARSRRRTTPRRAGLGQATVEFAIVSIVFLMIVLGTIDLGRGIYVYSELTNAAREGARYAQVAPTSTSQIKNRVISKAPGLNLGTSNVTVTCPNGCTTGNDITVKVSMNFSLIAQNLLGISPFVMHASATDAIN